MSRSSTSSSDGLIVVSPAPRARAIAVVTLFLGVCGGTGVVDLVSPAGKRAIGLEAEQEAERWEKARFWDGSLATEVERALRKRSSVRGAVLPPWTALMLGVFGETNAGVAVGRDGFLFRDGIHGWDRDIRDDVQDVPARAVSYLSRRLGTVGIRLVTLPVPSKASTHPGLLDPGHRPPANAYSDWTAALTALGVDVVDVAGLFARHADAQLFSRTDTHWSSEGARLAAKAGACAAGVFVPEAERTTVIRSTGNGIDAGNILDWMGIDSTEVRSGNLAGWLLDKLGHLHTIEGLDVFDRASGTRATDLVGKPGSPVVLVGTSFTGTAGFYRFVGHYSERRVFTYAVPGGGPVAALEDVLRNAGAASGGALPEALLWEFQAHSRYVTPFRFLNLSRLATYLPPGGFEPVRCVRVERTGDLMCWGKALAAGTLSGRMQWERLTHPGAGRVGIRLTGSTDRPVEVQVTFNRKHPPLRATWLPGTSGLTIPMLWPDVNDVGLKMTGTGATVTLDRIDLVWDLDTSRAVTARLGRPEATDDGWLSCTDLPAAEVATPGASILVLLPDCAIRCPVEIELVVDGKVAKRWTQDPLAQGVLVLAPPTLCPIGQATIKVRGTGPVPSGISARVSVVPQGQDP